jgi:ribosome maturation factor RimP
MSTRGRGGAQVQAARLAAVIGPVVRGAGFDLEDVSVSRVGRRHLVRVVVDHDSGVDLDRVAEVSRSASAALDLAEAAGDLSIEGEYVLEVSSPGVDRPLTQPRHWRRNIGRLVTVAVADGGGPVTGRVLAADGPGDETVVRLDIDGERREFPVSALGPGRVQVELRPDGGGQPGEVAPE